jgi:hypothetical protein
MQEPLLAATVPTTSAVVLKRKDTREKEDESTEMMGENDSPSAMMGEIGMPHAMHAMKECVSASEHECEKTGHVPNGVESVGSENLNIPLERLEGVLEDYRWRIHQAELRSQHLERDLQLLQTKAEGKRVQ